MRRMARGTGNRQRNEGGIDRDVKEGSDEPPLLNEATQPIAVLGERGKSQITVSPEGNEGDSRSDQQAEPRQAWRGRAGSHLRVRSAERQSLISPERLCPDSAVDSGKTCFRPQKSSPRRRRLICNQWVEPILATPAGSRNRARFAPLGSGPAVEFNAMFRTCQIRHNMLDLKLTKSHIGDS